MSTSAYETTLLQDIASYLRYQLRGWRGVVGAAVIIAVPALWFGWPWLVAAGLAPLILAVAPCAIMCAAGLCVSRAGNKSALGSSASESARLPLQRAGVGEESEPSRVLGACCAENDIPAETETPRSEAAEPGHPRSRKSSDERMMRVHRPSEPNA